EQGRLAAAVGTDDAEDLALVHVERHAVDRDDTAEALLQIAHGEDGAHRAPSRPPASSAGTVSAARGRPLPAAGFSSPATRPSRPEGETTISNITSTA